MIRDKCDQFNSLRKRINDLKEKLRTRKMFYSEKHMVAVYDKKNSMNTTILQWSNKRQ